jgi:quercetin dioxygenase-like cupin family protein
MRCATLFAIPLILPACGGGTGTSDAGTEAAGIIATAPAVVQTPLVLGLDEGETRIWRHAGVQFTLKVDRRNGGSPELVMGYQDVPPGVTMPLHTHLEADEIIFVHRGSGTATVGDLTREFATGGTIYIPRNTPVTLTNTGEAPLSIVFVFSRPGFDDLMRDLSVPVGEEVEPISPDEVQAILESHRSHTVYH